MIFRNIKNLTSSLKEISCFLIYGPNHEKINMSLQYISSIFEQYNKQYLDFSSLEQIDILEKEISNHNIFDQKNLFLINLPYPEKVFPKIKRLNLDKIDNSKIIFKATELRKTSKFRVMFEESNSLACLPCYESNQSEIKKNITQALELENLEISEDLLNLMATFFHQNKNNNISSEIEKIVIFMKSDQKLDEKSFLKITNYQNNFDLENLVYAIISGDLNKLDFLFGLKKKSNFSNIVIINSLVSHLYKLIYFIEKYKLTGSKQAALKSIKPPIFFKYENEFLAQSKIWKTSLIEATLKKLFLTEKKLKTQTNFEVADFIFLSIAKFANKLKL